MSQTVAQVVSRAANDLGLLRLGQTLQSQDNTRVNQAYNEVHAQLKRDGLAVWSSTAAVPDEYVPHVAALVAKNCLQTYSVPTDRYKRIMLDAQEAVREIRKLSAPEYVSTDKPENF